MLHYSGVFGFASLAHQAWWVPEVAVPDEAAPLQAQRAVGADACRQIAWKVRDVPQSTAGVMAVAAMRAGGDEVCQRAQGVNAVHVGTGHCLSRKILVVQIFFYTKDNSNNKYYFIQFFIFINNIYG
jgi:hypothetical protein